MIEDEGSTALAQLLKGQLLIWRTLAVVCWLLFFILHHGTFIRSSQPPLSLALLRMVLRPSLLEIAIISIYLSLYSLFVTAPSTQLHQG